MQTLKSIISSYQFFWGRYFFLTRLTSMYKGLFKLTFYGDNLYMFMGALALALSPLTVLYFLLEMLVQPLFLAIVYPEKLQKFIEHKKQKPETAQTILAKIERSIASK